LSFLYQVNLGVEFFNEVFNGDIIVQIPKQTVGFLDNDDSTVRVLPQEPEHFIKVLPSLLFCTLPEREFTHNFELVLACVPARQFQLRVQREALLLLFAGNSGVDNCFSHCVLLRVRQSGCQRTLNFFERFAINQWFVISNVLRSIPDEEASVKPIRKDFAQRGGANCMSRGLVDRLPQGTEGVLPALVCAKYQSDNWGCNRIDLNFSELVSVSEGRTPRKLAVFRFLILTFSDFLSKIFEIVASHQHV
jgi:hypothetical protein